MDRKAIEKELAYRELASRKLAYFVKYTKDDYQMVATQNGRGIHEQIIEKLEAVRERRIKRLIINCPPGTGKSELVSIRFPAWCLGKDPKEQIIVTSYGAELANDFGRKAKQVVEGKEFTNVFPDFKMSTDKREGGRWETSVGGGMLTAGVGGAVTGKRGSIRIIDDPTKDRKEAESPTTQQRVIDWYTSVLYTRARDQSSPIIVMMTRWNINDLAGYLIAEEANGGDHWEILSIPAIDPEGHPIIWPGKWDENFFTEEVMNNVSPKDWAALYQQDPIASGSNIFMLSDIRYFLMSDFERDDGILKKEDLKVVLFVDPAWSSSDSSDDACAQLVGKHRMTGNYYQLDLYAATSIPSKTYAAVLAMYDRGVMDGFNIPSIDIESAKISKGQEQFIKGFKDYLKARDRYITVNEVRSVGKKEDRIKFILEPKMSLHSIHFRRDSADKVLMKKQETQITDFPNVKHDDIIDCLALACDRLDTKGEKKKTENKPRQFVNRMTGKTIQL